MDMIFIEILQLNCYAVPELPPSRNPLHNCTTFSLEGDFLRAWLIFTTWQAIPFERKFYLVLGFQMKILFRADLGNKEV